MNLTVRGITFYYDSIKALKDVGFELKKGEVLGIIGPNGSGKTTLLRCINMTLEPEMGTVLIDGRNILEMDRKEVARHIGVVPQSPAFSFPFSVFDVVLMGRTPWLNRFSWESSGDIDIARRAMEITGTLSLAARPIDELSGGEKQRVIIAKALAQQPEILLLDEPTLHLDINHQLEILELIKKLAKEKGLMVVLVSHDLNLAARYSDRLLLLKEGKIFSTGPPGDVITEEGIREVYGVGAEISFNKRTWSYIVVPLGSP
ncbi:MAG: ABC transporter ATP-binding protein [Thermoplasmata archaeon]|nr:ABC transporter ATP-binding protein [Thermoplasmata archaeon]